MTSRYEIDIPHGKEEAFRQVLEGFEGAKIVKDGGKITAEQARKKAIIDAVINPLLSPVDPEVVDKVAEGYAKLFNAAFPDDIYSSRSSEAVVSIKTQDDILRMGQVLHKLFDGKSRTSNPVNLAILVNKYGLVDGEPKNMKATIEAAGYKAIDGRRQELHGFLAINHGLTINNPIPDLLEIKPRV